MTNNNHVAVIDGATNISGTFFDDKAPGRIAAEIIQKTIREAPRNISLKNLVNEINGHFQALYERLNILDELHRNPWKTPTASFICYSDYYNEIWQIGDCQCLIDGQHYENDKQLDKIIAEIRAFFLETELKRGKTIDQLLINDTSETYISNLSKRQYELQNDAKNPYGFDVINGFKVDYSRSKKMVVPKHTETIVLASDGYPFLKEHLSETEALLEAILLKDPLCFREFKSSKGLKKGNVSFDDRTYIKFRRNK